MTTLHYAKETKAIKEHRCNFCNGIIRVGMSYMKSTHEHDGTVYDWKSHKHCAELAVKMKMYEDADEGVTEEIFRETVSSKYFDLMLAQFSEEDVLKYTDAIQHLRYVDFHHKLTYVLHRFAKQEKEKAEAKKFIESKLEIEYKDEGYVPYYNKIDAEVSNEGNCNKCNSNMRYIGLKKESKEDSSGQSQLSYIAISHCDNCGYEYEF